MIDFTNSKPGDMFGCQYSFNVGAVGNFHDLTTSPNDGRKVKDPVELPFTYFTAIRTTKGDDLSDPHMYWVGGDVELYTSRTFEMIDTALDKGIESSTIEYIDFNKYKKVIDFTTEGEVKLTAIPKDLLLITKQPYDIDPFTKGIYSMTINVTNIFCKVALSVDGSTFFTYNKASKSWATVDIMNTPKSDLINQMMDYTVLPTIGADSYIKQFPGLKQLSIAFLIGIEEQGIDIGAKHSLDTITIDYVGTDDSPATQYFNLIHSGYDHNGNIILMSDRVIQNNISYHTIYNAGYAIRGTNSNIKFGNSDTIKQNIYARLPISSNDKLLNSEWEELIVNSPYLKNKSVFDMYNTEISSFTNTIAINADPTGVTPAPRSKFVTRGGQFPDSFSNFGLDEVDKNHGWRPVFIVNLSDDPAQEYPGFAFTPVKSIQELAPGKCISCDYNADGGTLRNKYCTGMPMQSRFGHLGDAQYPLLSDYKNTDDGSFFFNCVGYDQNNNPICIADRVVQTNLTYSSIIANRATMTSSNGFELQIDNDKHMSKIMYARNDETQTSSEYDDLMTNDYNPNLTVDEIWHTSKTLSFTNTIADKVADGKIVVKGKDDDERTDKPIRKLHFNTLYEDTVVGYRPVVIFKPIARVTKFKIMDYVTYDLCDFQDMIMMDIEILSKDNTPLGFKIYETGNPANVIMDYPHLPKSLTYPGSTFLKVGTNNFTLARYDEEGKKTYDMLTFVVQKDKDLRLTTTRTIVPQYCDGFTHSDFVVVGSGRTNVQLKESINSFSEPDKYQPNLQTFSVPSSTDKIVIN